MAEEANGSAATRADEIADLKRQMKEMQKRLEQLSGTADEGAAADKGAAAGEATASEGAAAVEEAADVEAVEAEEAADIEMVEAMGAAEEPEAGVPENRADAVGATDAADALVEEAAAAGGEGVEAITTDAAADETAAPAAEEFPVALAESDAVAPAKDDAPAMYAGVPAKAGIEGEPVVAVEPVPVVGDESPVAEKAEGDPAPASPYATEETDEEYTAAAVADFMPQSEPPQPAPPVYGAPAGYTPQPGQPGPYAQQQAQQPPVSPYGQQPYAQQPGQTSYYQQNPGYYSAPQGGYAQPQGGYQSQYQQPLVRTKDHVAAGLLAIFLGVFGVHKFYLGYNTAGFILLGVTILGGIFTLGIASSVVWLIGIIEGVIYLTKSQPEFEQIYIFNKREWF